MNIRMLMLFAVLAIFVSLGFSTTIVVNGTTNCTASPDTINYSTISAAVANSAHGDTIIVCMNDTTGYHENVLIDKRITIFGFNASGSGGVWVYAANNTTSVFTITASQVNISNLTIAGANNSAGTLVSGIYVTGENVSIFNNTLTDNVYGVVVYDGGYQVRVFNNTVYSNRDTGIALHGSSSYSKAYNNDLSVNRYYSIYSSTANNDVENNTIYADYASATSMGMMFDAGSSSNKVYNNVVYNVYKGIQAQGSAYNNYTSNSVYNTSYAAFFFNNGGTYAVLTSNAFYNSTRGIWVSDAGASSSNFTSNILENNTYGVYVSAGSGSPSGLRFTTNRVFNNTYGFYFSSIDGLNHIYGNTELLNNTYGVFLSSSSNINVTNNDITNGVYSVYLTGSSSNLVNNNRIKGNETYGVSVLGSSSSNTYSGNNITGNGTANTALFYMASSTETTFTGNKLDNSSKALYLLGSTLTFSGNNEIYNTTATGYDVYINESSTLSTGGYNITTNNFPFRLGDTVDVSIKALLANESIHINSTNNSITLPGITEFTAGNASNYSNGVYATLNVTGTSDSGSLSAYMFYDPIYTPTIGNNIKLGDYDYALSRHNSMYDSTAANGIVYRPGSGFVSGANGYILIIAYNTSSATSVGSTSSSGSSTTVYSPSLTKSFDCKTGDLTVTLTYSGSGVSGTTVKLYNTRDYSQTLKSTDSEGKAVFTVKSSGNYEVDSEASSSYTLQTLGPFELTLCNEVVTTPVTPTTTPTTTPATPTTTPTTTPATTPVTPTPDLRNDALAALASADSAISTAVSAGKDVTAAKAKLVEANVALTNGDYAKAKSLSEEAALLAKNAAAKPAEPTAPVAVTPTPTSVPPQKGMDLGAILIGLVVVVVVVLGVYFLSRGGKTSKGHFKGHRRV